jgi:putative ABC transport system ATP-binding protein
MATAQIRAEQLEITYNAGKSNAFLALKSVDAEIYAGEYIILFGASGSGKSTLMYSILGSIKPSGGKLYVKDEDVYAYTPEEMVNYQQKVVGIIFQKFNLIPSLSVIDNVALPQVFASVEMNARMRKAQELLDRFGVGSTTNKLPTNLSGGQQQRIAVARSLVNDPEILLADEPVGNLDSISSEQVMHTLNNINAYDKKTIILVTHDAKHLPYAHRIYYVHDGHIIREVMNPEKKQIKKTEERGLVTEMEQLARLYPYYPIKGLRVKSLVNYLTLDLDFNQIGTLERAVEEVILGKLGPDAFNNILKRPTRQGGVGLDKDRAKMMTEKVKTIMTQSRGIARYRASITKAPEYYQQKFIKRLREYLVQEYGKKLSDKQIKNLDEAITDRLSGYDRHEEFLTRMSRSIRQGGLGMKGEDAFRVTRHLEKLLAQGLHYIDRHANK